MNFRKFLASTAAVLLLTACSQKDVMDVNQADRDLQNNYTKGWVTKFGLIDPNQDWNMATLVKAEVDPAAFGDDVDIRIYTAHPRNRGRLIGLAHKACTLNLDVLKGTTSVYVIAAKGKEVVNSGTYAITGGKVTINRPASSRAASRDSQLLEDTGTDYFDWIIACEDLGDDDDFDFNDIVFGVKHVSTDGHEQVAITGLAAGGVLAARIYVGEAGGYEIHDLVKEGSETTDMLNTWGWGGIDIDKSTRTIPVSDGWHITDGNLGGIKIEVEGRPTALHAAETGSAPQIICVQGDWQWPVERKDIKKAYSGFETWNREADKLDWISTCDENLVIKWKGENTTPVTPDPEPIMRAMPDYSKVMIDNQAQQWSGNWKEGGGNPKWQAKKVWDYVPGLVTKAVLTYCEQYADGTEYDDSDTNYRTYLQWGQDYADRGLVGSDFLNNGTYYGPFGKNGDGSLDNIASGKVLISLYELTGNENYEKAATTMYNFLKNNYRRISAEVGDSKEATGGFWHKPEYPNQMWLDGLYMGAAFYAEYQAKISNDKTNVDAWNDITLQFTILHDKTLDSTTGLNFHAWSCTPTVYENEVATAYPDSFWADPNTGCSPEVWGRGMGWYFAALVDVLDYLGGVLADNTSAPAALQANYNTLKGYYTQAAAAIVAKQTTNGWYQLMRYGTGITDQSKKWNNIENNAFKAPGAYTVDGGQDNYLEASASCMFTYGLLKGLRLGLLDESTYGAAADNAFDGLSYFVDNSSNINHVCESAGLGAASKPYRDGSISYYLNGNDTKVVSNDGKALGPYIFAALEYELRHPVEVIE